MAAVDEGREVFVECIIENLDPFGAATGANVLKVP
jgi:hypothetical protein